MLDGFKCSCVGLNPEVWLNNPALDFSLSVSANTGELSTEYMKAKADSLTFSVRETAPCAGACSIAGSLHKFHNAPGCYNWDCFTFPELLNTLEQLREKYGIDIYTAELHGLEIGVNIHLNYSPQRVFRSAICHNGKAFDSIDGRNKKLGIICDHTDYTIKLYDKGKQTRVEKTNGYILRVEVKTKRKRMLEPYGIKTLSDLQGVEKVATLLQVLTDKISGIVFFDFSFDTTNLSDKKKMNWERFSNPKYWETLNKNKAYKARQYMAGLTKKYGAIDGGDLLTEKVIKEWFSLLGMKLENGHIVTIPEYDNFWNCKHTKQATISKLEYVVEKVATGDHETQSKTPLHQGTKKGKKQPVSSSPKEQPKERRFCSTCGREITHLRAEARFCSEKERGKAAKQCRNADSNRRLSMKRKIERAMKNEKLLRIIYTDEHGNEYNDILGADEMTPTREWLDRVLSVEILKEDNKLNQPMTGKEAKNYLQRIKNKKHENENY